MPAQPWKTTLILSTEHRDALDGLATRIRQRTDVRPGVSELVRALVEAGLESLAEEREFDGLDLAVGGRGARSAAPLIERWLIDRLRDRG